MIDSPSLAKFTAFVQLKDFRGPTKTEYVRYVRRLGDHYHSDPATLTEDQVRAYYLELRQVRHFGASATPDIFSQVRALVGQWASAKDRRSDVPNHPRLWRVGLAGFMALVFALSLTGMRIGARLGGFAKPWRSEAREERALNGAAAQHKPPSRAGQGPQESVDFKAESAGGIEIRRLAAAG